MRRNDYSALAGLISRSPLSSGDTAPYAAIAATETGRIDEATCLFSKLPTTDLAIWRIRHALRSGNVTDALTLIDGELAGPGAADAWPYAFLAWRVVSHPRAAWLATEAVKVIDLSERLPLGDLARTLRSLHSVSGQFLDQSVRGGSQTDGPLLSRLEPELRATRGVIVGAVEDFRRALPASRSGHPLLGPRRDRRIRFAGSWSIRLSSRGHHAAHVHPQGWISSALYVSVPSGLAANQGWLELGAAPPDLGLVLPATHLIQPKPGRLVLFPSWLWHSTRPFCEGERLTIAFDIALPR